MRDLLHDEVDIIEELMDESKAVVEEIVKDQIETALLETGDVTEAFRLITSRLEEQLIDTTTRAFRVGAQFAEKRVSQKGTKDGISS